MAFAQLHLLHPTKGQQHTISYQSSIPRTPLHAATTVISRHSQVEQRCPVVPRIRHPPLQRAPRLPPCAGTSSRAGAATVRSPHPASRSLATRPHDSHRGHYHSHRRAAAATAHHAKTAAARRARAAGEGRVWQIQRKAGRIRPAPNRICAPS